MGAKMFFPSILVASAMQILIIGMASPLSIQTSADDGTIDNVQQNIRKGKSIERLWSIYLEPQRTMPSIEEIIGLVTLSLS